MYILNINSHEVFLAISGFFIPLYLYNSHKPAQSINNITALHQYLRHCAHDWKTWILIVIYGVSAITMVLSPGMGLRKNTWQATGSYLDGIGYSLQVLEVTLRMLFRFYIPVILIFLLGLGLRFTIPTNKVPKQRDFFHVFLFCSPLIYIAVAGFLFGMFNGYSAIYPEPLLSRELLSYFLPKNDILTLNNYALGTRQNLFIFSMIFFNLFLSGFLIGGLLRTQYKIKDNLTKPWLFRSALFITTTTLFLFHPDGVGSMHTLAAFFKGGYNFNEDAFGNTAENPPNESLLQSGLAYFPHHFSSADNTLFPRFAQEDFKGIYKFSINTIWLSNYFESRQGKAISDLAANKVREQMRRFFTTKEQEVDAEEWSTRIYHQSKVFKKNNHKCVSIKNGQETAKRNCSNYFLNKDLIGDIFNNQIKTDPMLMSFNTFNGVKKIARDDNNCIHLSETHSPGEHFITTNIIHLSKGYYYFVFEGKPTSTALFLFIMQDNHGRFMLPWFNNQTGYIGIWSKLGTIDSTIPVFSQVETTENRMKLKTLLYSASEQDINFRWQLGNEATTSYLGNPKNTSIVCNASYKKIAG